MKRALYIIICMLTLTVACRAQLVVDLQKGGATVRSKTIRDYDVEHKDLRQQREDSLAYIDNLRRAFTALHEDSLRLARKHFETALKLRPDAPANFVLHHNLGRIALAEGNYNEALLTFTKILRDRPNDMEVRYDRATTYLEMNNPKAAIEDADVLLRAASTDSVRRLVHFLRGAAEMRIRLHGEARKDFEEVLRLDPDNENALLLLVMTLQQDGRPREARQRLDTYVAAHPADLDARFVHAGLCMQGEDYEAAVKDLDVILAAQPKNAECYVMRAVALRKLGHKAESRKDVDAAVALGVPRSEIKKRL